MSARRLSDASTWIVCLAPDAPEQEGRPVCTGRPFSVLPGGQRLANITMLLNIQSLRWANPLPVATSIVAQA